MWSVTIFGVHSDLVHSENPVLIGHKGFRFDAAVILRSMIRFGLFADFKDAC